MPSDIRYFFGGGRASQGTPSSQEKPLIKKDESANKRKRNSRKVVEDESDDEIPTKKSTPKNSTPKKPVKVESPKRAEISTSDYFASSKPKPAATPKSTPTKVTSNGRTSARSKASASYEEFDDEDDDAFADIAIVPTKHGGSVDGANDDDEDVKPRHKRSQKPKQARVKKEEEDPYIDEDDVDMDDVDPEDDEFEPQAKEKIVKNTAVSKGKTTAASSGRKRKSDIFDDEDEDEEEPAPKKGKGSKTKSPSKASPAKRKSTGKKVDEPEDKAMQDIFDSIPTVRPPTPPQPSTESKPFSFRDHAQSRGQAPPMAGSKEIPVGAENCLAGLTFVFTGLLESLGREEGQELVKRYGGKVTSAPSSKTNFVVLGSDAGPKKLETIRKYNLKTIGEDGLFDLIRKIPAHGGGGKAAEKALEKKQQEEEKVRQMAAEMEKEERRKDGAGGAGNGTTGQKNGVPGKHASLSELWTVKYAPKATKDICGNKGQVEKLQRWLRNWHNNARLKFKKPGVDGSGLYRAVIIHGSPGIGKTSAAHLIAKLEGFDILETNASDTRSKKLVETGLKGILDNTSLLGYFAGDDKKVEESRKKLVLIMDEVDGMSAGDRGGVGALAAICKKTHIPMILICNERKLPKMRPFDNVAFEIAFRKPTVQDIRSRIMTICFREGLKFPPNVIDALIEGSHADIRQIINMISTARLDQTAMDFDQGKAMSKAWEKHVILKPWDITSKLLGGGMFASSSKATLNDKIELYFNDHEFSYLMIQENYLKTQPIIANNYSGREKRLKNLELIDKAAESISDGDLVDRMIHGSQQQWSLMPTHAVFSTVTPASFISGSLAGAGGISFTSWLGQNSKQGKLGRFIKEIQGHMRLRASGDRDEIRQQYLPLLWYELIKKLQDEGKEAVPEVIELMDSYYLTKEDWDAILELGVGDMNMERVKLETQTKATFTRIYNQQSHPMPFMKASSVVAPKKISKEQPDLEEAIEESDEGDDPTADKADDEEEELDLSKDKYVKVPKAKKAASKKSAAKKKAAVDNDDEDIESDEDVKPKKGKAKAASKGKGKSKK